MRRLSRGWLILHRCSAAEFALTPVAAGRVMVRAALALYVSQTTTVLHVYKVQGSHTSDTDSDDRQEAA